MKKCYVASPYGFAEGTKYWYDNVLLPVVSQHVEVLDPWTLDVPSILAGAATPREAWLTVGHKHLDNIKNNAELMIALLDQEPPDNGTVVEVAWAVAHNIPVIAYRNDLRTGGEDGMPYNLMIAAAVERSGGTFVGNLVELEETLTRYR